MAQPNSQPEGASDDKILRHAPRDIQERGEGGAIYLKKKELEDLGLEHGEEVDVQYVVRDGSLVLEARADSHGGFTKEELLDFAMEQEWKRLHGLTAGDMWAYSFANSTETVKIEIDSEGTAGDEILDNISIVGPLIEIDEDLDKFDRLTEIASEDSMCRVEIQDSEGVWEQFLGADSSNSEIPERDAVHQLTRKAETVKAQLVATRPSVLTPLEEVKTIVDEIRARSDFETA